MFVKLYYQFTELLTELLMYKFIYWLSLYHEEKLDYITKQRNKIVVHFVMLIFFNEN